MNIWLCPSAFFPHKGGVEELTFQLARRLQLRGHTVLVVTNRWPHRLPETEVIDGIDIVRIPFTLPARRPASVLKHISGLRIAETALTELPTQPDVIHVQCASSQLQHLRKHSTRRQVPLVLTTQGETVVDAQGLYDKNPWMRRELRHTASTAAHLTACSSWTRQAASLVAPAFRHASVVLNGVEPSDWPIFETVSGPVFAAWGRHVPQKGLDLLIRAFALLRTKDPHATLLVGGEGPDTPALRAIAGPGVRFLGPLDRAGVASMLSEARVAVVPSRVEPFGVVALEALAAGRGLVYSVHGGLSEAAGGCGRAADPFDPVALSTAMLAELQEPTAPDRGRNRAEALSWNRIADEYDAIYHEVTGLP